MLSKTTYDSVYTLREWCPQPHPLQFQSTIALSADDTKLYKCIDFSGAKNYLQADHNNLEKLSHDCGMEFNKSKCQVLHVSRKKSRVG